MCQSSGGSESRAEVEGERPTVRDIEAANGIELENHARRIEAYASADASQVRRRAATKTIGHPESSAVNKYQPLDRQTAKL